MLVVLIVRAVKEVLIFVLDVGLEYYFKINVCSTVLMDIIKPAQVA
jgi:hypothetical protein